MTVKEAYNKLGKLIETGQITGDEEFGLWEYSYEEGDYFWSPEKFNISDDYTKVELN
jgi:hypothetical protein